MANVLLGIHCAVPGCSSTLRKVNQWKSKFCVKPKHKGKTHAQCMCPEPYQFFKFPTGIKLQKMWLERVKRPDLEINNLTRVCSLHFVEGKPTRRNYFPSINLKLPLGETELSEQELEIDDDADDDDDQLVIEEAVTQRPQPANRNVSVVPMELLQEDTEEDDEQEEYNEGDLTISRYSYENVDEDEMDVQEAYNAPTNTVTITRVSTGARSPAKSATCIRASTASTRMATGMAGIASKSKVITRNTVTASNDAVIRRPQVGKIVQQQPVSKFAKGSTRNANLRKENADQGNSGECPYEIDMVIAEDEEEEGSSESYREAQHGTQLRERRDLARERRPPPPQLESRSLSAGKSPSTSSQVTSIQQKDLRAQTKVIPVLAVAPKSHQQQQSNNFPVITRVDSTASSGLSNVQKKATNPSNSTAGAPATSNFTTRNFLITGSRTLVSTNNTSVSATTSLVTPSTGVISKSTTFTTGTTTTTVSPSTPTTAGVVQKISQPQNPTLATYDPSKQQLQITDPVKYIQECHTRIATLLADKQKLENQNKELESKVLELQKSNNDLRREIVHQALNAAKRATPQMQQANINLIPTITVGESISNEEGNSRSSSSVPPASKSRIRYVIRRPSQLTKINLPGSHMK